MRNLALKWFWVALITSVVGYWAYRHLHIEQDVVASIERSRPEEAAIFHKLQGSDLFQDRVFFRLNEPNPALESELWDRLREAGYHRVEAFAPTGDVKDLYRLLPFLPNHDELLSARHQAKTFQQVENWLTAPGGLGMLKLLMVDPLLLSQELPKLIQGTQTNSGAAPLVAKRDGDIDWEKVRALYTFVRKHDSELSYISGDFYALENYDAVQHDIILCSGLSLVLSLAVFRYFCRQWSLLLYLTLGTAVSSVLGLALAEAVDGTLYGLVLAFTSTFVSFNNETLVHLSGVDFKKLDARRLVGVFSALGTTIIGFLVMLFSHSHMARQIAVISLGSLFGFILFLLVFRFEIQKLAFRAIHLKPWPWNKKVLTVSFLVTLALILILPKPDYQTNLEEFRFASPGILAQTERFAKSYQSFSFETMHAVPLAKGEDPAAAYGKLQESRSLAPDVFHPLADFVSPERQQEARAAFNRDFDQRLRSMEEQGRELGLKLVFPREAFLFTETYTSRDYLALWSKLWPLPWFESLPGHDYLLVFLGEKAEVPGAIPMHPRAFYEYLLSDLTRNLGTLFLIGLGVMLLYLVPWQRQWHKIALIFLPLLLATLGLQVFFYATGRHITIVHVMGLSLVIAVALDYASILVSGDHDPKDQGKVVLTGGLTLCSFGTLLFARHPVLRELALIVVMGTLVAFVMALFTRMPEEKP